MTRGGVRYKDLLGHDNGTCNPVSVTLPIMVSLIGAEFLVWIPFVMGTLSMLFRFLSYFVYKATTRREHGWKFIWLKSLAMAAIVASTVYLHIISHMTLQWGDSLYG